MLFLAKSFVRGRIQDRMDHHSLPPSCHGHIRWRWIWRAMRSRSFQDNSRTLRLSPPVVWSCSTATLEMQCCACSIFKMPHKGFAVAMYCRRELTIQTMKLHADCGDPPAHKRFLEDLFLGCWIHLQPSRDGGLSSVRMLNQDRLKSAPKMCT